MGHGRAGVTRHHAPGVCVAPELCVSECPIASLSRLVGALTACALECMKPSNAIQYRFLCVVQTMTFAGLEDGYLIDMVRPRWAVPASQLLIVLSGMRTCKSAAMP